MTRKTSGNTGQAKGKTKAKKGKPVGFVAALLEKASTNLTMAQGALEAQDSNYAAHIAAYQVLLQLATGGKLSAEDRSVLGEDKFTDGTNYAGIGSLLVDAHKYRGQASRYETSQERLRAVRSERNELSDKCVETGEQLRSMARTGKAAGLRYEKRGEELKRLRAEANEYRVYQASMKFWDRLNKAPYTRLTAAVKSERAYAAIVKDSLTAKKQPTVATVRIQEAVEVGRFIVALGKALSPYSGD